MFTVHNTQILLHSVFSLFFAWLDFTLQYGADLQEGLTTEVRVTQTTIYRSDMPLYTQRMQRAIDLVAMYSDDVSVDDIAIIGYCFVSPPP
jgi:dienelactone hydrolase